MQQKPENNNVITSSYFWVRVSLSSSDISGLKTAIVSYCLSPGGHWGSSFSSTAVAKPTPPVDGGSSSFPNPPLSKKEPEKSRVWALIDKDPGGFFLRNVCDLGEKDFKIVWENERADGVDDNVRVFRDGDEKDDIFMAWRSEK